MPPLSRDYKQEYLLQKEHRQLPAVKERNRRYMREYFQRPDVRARNYKQNREYRRKQKEYRQRPEVKARNVEAVRRWQTKNPDNVQKYRQKRKERYASDPNYKQHVLGQKRSDYLKNRRRYQEYMKKWRKDHHDWRKEYDTEKYANDETLRQKCLVRTRDGRRARRGSIKKEKCERCGLKGSLDLHHLTYHTNKQNKVYILCRKCHIDEHTRLRNSESRV